MEGLPDKNCDLWWKVYPPFGGGKELVVKIIIIFLRGGGVKIPVFPPSFSFFFSSPSLLIPSMVWIPSMVRSWKAR